MDVGARHPEGGHVLRHPSEVGAEAVCAVSAGRPGRGPGDMSGGRVGFGQQGGQQQHRGPAGDERFYVSSDRKLAKISQHFILFYLYVIPVFPCTILCL